MNIKNFMIFILIASLGFTLFMVYQLNNKVTGIENALSQQSEANQNIGIEANSSNLGKKEGDTTSDHSEGINAEALTIELFENAAPSVTFITTIAEQQNLWTRNVTEIPGGTGSGFIWDKEGHIVTNFHVIENAKKAHITLADNTTYPAKLVGIAPDKDLAILKIDAPSEKLIPIPRGQSFNLKVGQTAFAIGNPFGLDQTLTTGIISALGREIQSRSGIPIRDVIQTDAAINPGNSGGPLLDSSGKLIGVNTAIYSPSGTYAGIGFSIPVDVINWVIPDLIEHGELKRPRIGIEMVSKQTMERLGIVGAMVMNIVPDSPAEEAGLRPTSRNNKGDVIIGLNGKKIGDNLDLILDLEKYKEGDQINLQIIRDEKEIEVQLILDIQK